jgi:hypothetical protein
VRSQLVGKGCFGPVADHFDDILYQLAFVLKLVVACGFLHFFYGDLSLVLFSFGLEAIYFTSSMNIGSSIFAFIYFQSAKNAHFSTLRNYFHNCLIINTGVGRSEITKARCFCN